MDVILKVLEGAKTGAKVAIKKEEFLIGRSQKCHLCVGSTAVSRRHCAIYRQTASVTIKDLGSRNGTLVNDERISGEVELSSGDEIVVGPLRFQLTISTGISNLKRPKVKTVAEAVERTVNAGDSSIHEDDITQWLLDSESPAKAATETQTIRMDDTNAVNLQNALAKSAAEEEEASDSNISDSSIGNEDEASDANGKKKPGKLPKVKKEPDSKDSCEAASAALRNWNRRR